MAIPKKYHFTAAYRSSVVYHKISPKRIHASGMYIRNYSGDIFFTADSALLPLVDRKSVHDVFYGTTEKLCRRVRFCT